MKFSVFVLLCLVAGVAIASAYGNGGNNGPYGGGNYGGRGDHKSSSSESDENKEKPKRPCKEVFSCKKEPVFKIAEGVTQRCQIGGELNLEIDCQRCCETWALSEGVAKDKQSGSYDWDARACHCCKLQCQTRFPF